MVVGVSLTTLQRSDVPASCICRDSPLHRVGDYLLCFLSHRGRSSLSCNPSGLQERYGPRRGQGIRETFPVPVFLLSHPFLFAILFISE